MAVQNLNIDEHPPPPIIVLGTAACAAQWWTVVRHGARPHTVAGEWIGWVRCNVGAY